MRDTARVEAAFRRSGRAPIRNGGVDRPRPSRRSELMPMDIKNMTLKKSSPAGHEVCRKQERCFNCCEKGLWPRSAQKAVRTE